MSAEVMTQVLLAFVGGVGVLLLFVLGVAARRITQDRTDIWGAIDQLRDQDRKLETKEDADRRSLNVWNSLESIRKSVHELNVIASGKFVTRDELRQTIRELKSDLIKYMESHS